MRGNHGGSLACGPSEEWGNGSHIGQNVPPWPKATGTTRSGDGREGGKCRSPNHRGSACPARHALLDVSACELRPQGAGVSWVASVAGQVRADSGASCWADWLAVAS